MSDKYRVVKMWGSYYPQHKGWFFWHFYHDLDGYKINFTKIDDAYRHIDHSVQFDAPPVIYKYPKEEK